MVEFGEKLKKLGAYWEDTFIDGCQYDLKNEKGNLMMKSWKVKTIDVHFASQYVRKTCTGGHVHEHVEGRENPKSSCYPWKLCVSIAKLWKKQVVGPSEKIYQENAAQPSKISERRYLATRLQQKLTS